MLHWPRLHLPHPLRSLPGAPSGGSGQRRRLLARLLALSAVAALAAWLGHLALAPAGHDAAARVAATVLGWLRAAWIP